MKHGLFTLLKQDTVLAFRNGLILVTGVTLIVIIGTYWILPFFLKGELRLSESQMFLDRTEDSLVKEFFARHDPGTDRFAADEKELEEYVAGTYGALGVIVTGNKDNLHYTLLFRNRPREETEHIIKAILRTMSSEITGEPFSVPYTIKQLRPTAATIPANQNMIVILLTFEVVILGFLFAAVLVFNEKKEGSIKAYRVTPSGLVNYVAAKTLVLTLLSLVYGIVMTMFTLGISMGFTRIPFLRLSLVLFIACTIMTLLGLGVAVFFKDLSGWFAPGVVLLSLNMLAVIPYNIPLFSSPVISLVPGYTVIFGVSELLFPTGKENFIFPLLGTLLVQLTICAVFALIAVRAKMMREA